MLGAIIGDVVGSIYEWDNVTSRDFPLFDGTEKSFFTDDTICTVALADCLMNDGNPVEYLQRYCRKYPNGGYGGRFREWIQLNDPQPYNSWGNGSAMRISPVAFALQNWNEIKTKTIEFTEITHNHEFGIAGALATSEAIYLSKFAENKEFLIDIILKYFPEFDISLSLNEIRPNFKFDESCQGTVPYAMKCVLESNSFESAIRNAIWLGGDCDTTACISGGIAQAYYKEIPDWISFETFKKLPDSFIRIIHEFNYRFKL